MNIVFKTEIDFLSRLKSIYMYMHYVYFVKIAYLWYLYFLE